MSDASVTRFPESSVNVKAPPNSLRWRAADMSIIE